MSARMSQQEQRLIEDNFKNTEEAWALLDLVDIEFRSDPASTQCFPAVIVERVKWCMARRREFQKRSVLGGLA
jgi:hypothetical protein